MEDKNTAKVVGIFRDKRLQSLVESGKIDPTKVSYLDTFNQSVQEEVVGCLKARIDQNNAYFVTEPQILTSRRTEEGRELRKVGIEKFENRKLVPREDGVSGTSAECAERQPIGEPLQKGDVIGSLQANACQRPHKNAVEGIAPCVNAAAGMGGSVGSTQIAARPNNVYGAATQYRIRKLTPRECFRLQGFSDEDIDKIQSSGVSKSAQYRIAGNSIATNCLYYLFKALYIEKEKPIQLTLF